MFVQLPGLPVALSLDAETASNLAELLEEKLVEMVQALNESPRDQWGAYRLQPDGWWSLDHSRHNV